MSEDFKPTRKNLLRVKGRIKLSERGHDTLEKKRDGLIMEFMGILENAKGVREELSQAYTEAQRTMNVARAMEGDIAVRGAAEALKEHPEIDVESKKIMGVVVPQIKSNKVRKTIDQRGYGLLGTTARIDESANSYERLLDSAILAAEVETGMRKLLTEIEITKRRVNALEFKVLPELYQVRKFIGQKLEEQEREEIFRLKKIKGKKGRESSGDT